jgi:hypothetical protein
MPRVRLYSLGLGEVRLQILHQLRVITRGVVALSRQPIVDVHRARHVQRPVRPVRAAAAARARVIARHHLPRGPRSQPQSTDPKLLRAAAAIARKGRLFGGGMRGGAATQLLGQRRRPRVRRADLSIQSHARRQARRVVTDNAYIAPNIIARTPPAIRTRTHTHTHTTTSLQTHTHPHTVPRAPDRLKPRHRQRRADVGPVSR